MPGRHGWRWQGISRKAVRFLEPALLLQLHLEPAHGYTLLERLKGFGLSDLDPSVAYRTLRDMEVQGWVTSRWDQEESQGPPRRVYCLTELGEEVLAAWMADLGVTRGMIDRLVEAYDRHLKDTERR
jgi:PadR family transcriptional regulator PadR